MGKGKGIFWQPYEAAQHLGRDWEIGGIQLGSLCWCCLIFQFLRVAMAVLELTEGEKKKAKVGPQRHN